MDKFWFLSAKWHSKQVGWVSIYSMGDAAMYFMDGESVKAVKRNKRQQRQAPDLSNC